MSNYRRRYVPGGTFFFTVVTHLRQRLFSSNEARACLRRATLSVQEEYPFERVATVLLPEHWHCVWTLPEDDVDYSKRLGLIKGRFTRLWLTGGGQGRAVSSTRLRHRERGIWQKRFWEHTIRDEVDLMRHVHYIHYNPVKHGLVCCPHAWPHSSFHRWVDDGYYAEDWLCECGESPIEVPQMLRQGEAFGE